VGSNPTLSASISPLVRGYMLYRRVAQR